MSTVAPYRCTGMMQRTRGPIAAATSSAREQARLRVRVDEPRRRAREADRLGGGDEGVGRAR